jgi:hypothetical protein
MMKFGASLVAAALTALSATPTLAAPAVLAQPYRGPASTTFAIVHRYFGLLEHASGSLLTLRRRNGTLLVVDASAAFAKQTVSAPLYAGKPTVVQGTLSANGVFHATSVKRAAPRIESWDIDR